LVERITVAGGGGANIGTVKDLVEEREQLRAKLKDSQKKLEEILAGRLPFHLVPKPLLDAFRDQLLAEIRYQEWEGEKRMLEPKRSQFENAFLSDGAPMIEPPLTVDQLLIIKNRIETAWASLFYPPPEDCAKEIVHDYLHESMRAKTFDFLATLNLGQKEIRALLNEQHDLQQRADELGRKVTRLEGIDRDGTLQGLKKELQAAQEDIDKVTEAMRVDDRRITTIDAQVSAQKAEYEREKAKLDESSPVRALIGKSERVRNVIEDVVPALFPLKVRELAGAMTEVYKRLAHKDQVDRIEIDNDGTARVLGKSGKEISFDRSAGENQIFATALIAGLAKVSRVRAPMVVDTPLGRLDSKHRDNILRFWISDENRQVILLSQDEEIDFSFFKQISDHVCKSYLLQHSDVGDGIGRTTAIEDKYFSKGRK